jgi:capsular polysaccharide transport system ATP-binding protein
MIKLENATKYFLTPARRKNFILEDANLVIPSGKNIGILGRNGAGKSTFLRMLGGIDFPNSGKISSDQSFSWPLALSGGFQGSMTGRNNAKFICRIYGRDNEEVANAVDFIQDFSELGDYFDMPIKNYSSGMKSKLSFAISMAFDFDYLLIDETLSVGDKNFRVKSSKALEKKQETSHILLVSHSMGTIQKMCDAGVVLNHGKIEYFDEVKDAIKRYEEIN